MMINVALILSSEEHLGIVDTLKDSKEINLFCFSDKNKFSNFPKVEKVSNVFYDTSFENLSKISNLSIILSDLDQQKLNFALPINVPFINTAGFEFIQKILNETKKVENGFKQNIEAQKIISDLGFKLTSAKCIEEISAPIIDCALKLTKTPAGSLALYNEKDNTLSVVAEKGFSTEFSSVKTYEVRKGGMNEYVLQREEPVVINDMSDNASFNNPLMLKEKVSSLMAVPLICKNKKIGILYVDDFIPRNFLPEEIASLSLLAMQAAFGIEKINLLNELEKNNQKLSETTDYMKAILNNSVDMIITTDSNTRIVEFNPGGEAILGYTKEEAVGSTAEKFYRNPEERRKIVDRLKKDGRLVNYETKLRRKDNKFVDISLSLSQLKNKQGEVIGTVGISKDISKQKQLEKKLKNANKELAQRIKEVQKIDEMKSDFLSVVSHELRTPLTSILGFAKMINKKFEKDIMSNLNMNDLKIAGTAEKIQRNLYIINSEGERLSRLINNVLDLAKIEAGKIEWKFSPAKSEDICQSALYSTSSLAEEKKLEFKFIHDDHIPLVNVDKDRMIQVVTNLLSNAIKFTEKGSVTCEIKNMTDHVEIRVKDSGIGIKEEYLTKVFEKFKQVGEKDTIGDRPKGTGLGLTICKEIVEIHKGKIWVESEYGQGSTFVFTLPVILETGFSKDTIDYSNAKENKFIEKIGQLEKGQLILIVDDEDHIRALLRQQLEDEGYRIIEAINGNEALVQARNQKPNLVICDIVMPGIDGFDVITLLKSNEQTANIPILIYSIYEDKEKGYRLGADEYITKSVNAEELIRSVSELLSGKKAKKKKVLIIEEDTPASRSIREALKQKGYEVVASSNSAEILKTENPDLIYIDDSISQDQEKILKTIQSVKDTEKSSIIILTRNKTKIEKN